MKGIDGIVTHKASIPNHFQQVDTFTTEVLKQLWKVYSVSKTSVDHGRRLENLFWRIWSSERTGRAFSGAVVSAIFMRIHRAEENIIPPYRARQPSPIATPAVAIKNISPRDQPAQSPGTLVTPPTTAKYSKEYAFPTPPRTECPPTPPPSPVPNSMQFATHSWLSKQPELSQLTLSLQKTLQNPLPSPPVLQSPVVLLAAPLAMTLSPVPASPKKIRSSPSPNPIMTLDTVPETKAEHRPEAMYAVEETATAPPAVKKDSISTQPVKKSTKVTPPVTSGITTAIAAVVEADRSKLDKTDFSTSYKSNDSRGSRNGGTTRVPTVRSALRNKTTRVAGGKKVVGRKPKGLAPPVRRNTVEAEDDVEEVEDFTEPAAPPVKVAKPEVEMEKKTARSEKKVEVEKRVEVEKSTTKSSAAVAAAEKTSSKEKTPSKTQDKAPEKLNKLPTATLLKTVAPAAPTAAPAPTKRVASTSGIAAQIAAAEQSKQAKPRPATGGWIVDPDFRSKFNIDQKLKLSQALPTTAVSTEFAFSESVASRASIRGEMASLAGSVASGTSAAGSAASSFGEFSKAAAAAASRPVLPRQKSQLTLLIESARNSQGKEGKMEKEEKKDIKGKGKETLTKVESSGRGKGKGRTDHL
ncbi:hypothetical protein BZA77DRAFT_292293 [Pyronema omphalodes]|nr:hypothetical protein BZA77DRAFT_292293 [Pyronema omphalodes]